MADMVQIAAQRFYEYENTKAFIIDVINGVPTPFIEAVSLDNSLPPTENAQVLSRLAMDYLVKSHRMLKFFGAKESRTLEDYIHKNGKTPRRTANYLLTELQNKLSPMGYSFAVRVLLEPYMHEEILEERVEELLVAAAQAA